MLDSDSTAQIFASLNRAIWIVTSADRGGQSQGGLVATWVMQTSLGPDRPAVCVGIAPNHYTRELIDSSGAFALHLLGKDQTGLAFPFCQGSAREFDKFAHCGQEGCQISYGGLGSPILTPVHSVLECQVFARLGSGDRIYYWADVYQSQFHGPNPPLTEQEFLAGLNESQLTELKSDLDRDILLQAPWQADWRSQIPPELQPRHEA